MGHGPQAPHALTRTSHDHLVGVCAARAQAAVSLAQANVGVPTEVLAGCGVLCESPWQVATDVGGITRRPGAFHQHPTGMTMASGGAGALPTPRTRGIFCGDQSHAWHECARGSDAAEVAEGRHQGDGHGTRHTAPRLKGLDPWVQAPGLGRLVACVLSTLETCRMGRDGVDVGLDDDGVRGGGTDHGGEPPEVSRAPRGPTRVTTLGSEEARVAPARGGFESPAGRFPRPGEVAPGISVDRGDIHRGEIT